MAKHFQALVAGTFVFAVAIVFFTISTHTNTPDSILIGIWITAGYLAFVTPNCRNFEPVLTAYVDVFARPEPYLVALDRLVKQRA